MTGAIFKVQYRTPGDKAMQGQVIGCFFFVTKNVVVTCHHVLNHKNFHAVKPYNHAQYFLLFGEHNIEIFKEQLIEYPDFDLTFIQLKDKANIAVHRMSVDLIQSGEEVHSQAYNAVIPPSTYLTWHHERLILHKYNAEKNLINYSGEVQFRVTMTEENTPNKQGIKHKNTKALVLSYGGKNGASGSAVILNDSKKIIGMINGGELINASTVKEFVAVSSLAIIEAMKKTGILKPWWKFW